jgi:AcrR family transcriptional regulator
VAATRLETQVRREQIAESMLMLIGAKGLKGLSVAAVARRIGLVPSALYRHFRNKEQMLDAALDLIGSRLRSNAETARRGAQDRPLESLRLLLVGHVELIRENRGIQRIVFSEDVYVSHPERRSKLYGMIREYLDRVANIVRRGQDLGEIRRDIDPQTAAMMFLGLVQPAAILWHISDGAFDVTKHAERAWRIFSEAIRVPCQAASRVSGRRRAGLAKRGVSG